MHLLVYYSCHQCLVSQSKNNITTDIHINLIASLKWNAASLEGVDTFENDKNPDHWFIVVCEWWPHSIILKKTT